MSDIEHDDYCPERGDRRCDCDWEARVRADEHGKAHVHRTGTSSPDACCECCYDVVRAEAERDALHAEVEADRENLSTRIANPEGWDIEQIDQWASERVALNRVLALLKEAQNG